MPSARDRMFEAIASITTSRPKVVLGVVAIVMVVFALLIPGLGVSTSRTSLVSDADPQQRRMNAFFERFGRPDVSSFVVLGETAEIRRGVVDRLEAKLEQDPRFEGRVIGRIRPEDVAATLLLQRPSALAELRSQVPPDVDLTSVLEAGLPGWLAQVRTALEANLDGTQAGPTDPADIAAGFERLEALASVLDDAIAGRDVMARWEDEMPSMERPGVDPKGYLVTDDGTAHLVTVFPELASDEGADLRPVVLALREARDEVLASEPSGVTADLTGLPSLSVDELAIVERGLLRSSIATTAGIFLLCLALFRSLRQTIVALLPLLPGVVLTLAFVKLAYGNLNLVTSSFMAVLLGLGIDFSVHVISRRNESVRSGEGEAAALQTALRRTGPGIMTGALVTAAAFLTNATTDFTAYAELGVITAVGLVVVMFATFFLLPSLLVLGRGAGAVRSPEEPPGLRRLPNLIRRGRVGIVVVSVGFAIAGGVALPRIAFDARYFSFLPQNTESARGLTALEYDAVASPVFAALTTTTVEDARALTERLRETPTVAGVQSPADLLPPLDDVSLATLRAGFAGLRRPDFAALAARRTEAVEIVPTLRGIVDALDEIRFAMQSSEGMPVDEVASARAAFAAVADRLRDPTSDDVERLATLHASLVGLLEPAWSVASAVAERGGYLPSDLPPLFASRYVARDGGALAIYAVPRGQFWDVDVAERFAADMRALDPDAVGLAMIHVAHGQMILAGFKRAAIIAAVLIVVALLVDFRRLDDALLALLPTALGWLWMLGGLAAFGVRFNVANIVALPLVLGIGIAFGVHMMHRVRESGGHDAATLSEVVRGTGGAVAVAALTTMVGFGGLMLGKYGAMISLGIVMVGGIGACLIATLFALPAVLSWLGRVR